MDSTQTKEEQNPAGRELRELRELSRIVANEKPLRQFAQISAIRVSLCFSSALICAHLCSSASICGFLFGIVGGGKFDEVFAKLLAFLQDAWPPR